jgi:hypothetical protein
MGRITALLLGICAALTLGTSAARAGAWQFVETSCQSGSSYGCKDILNGPEIALPVVVATFSSPDQTGSYQFADYPYPPIDSGDNNFTFNWEHFEGNPLPGPCSCMYVINWNGPPTQINYFQDPSSTNIDGGGSPDFSTFNIGSDGEIAGCGALGSFVGSGCEVSGYWEPVGVPEASTVTLLAGLLALTCAVYRTTIGDKNPL